MTEGVVNFISEEGFGVSAELQSGGLYTLRSHHGSGIPEGTYTVTVTPPPVETEEADGEADPVQPEHPQIPEKYHDFSTSGLEFTVGSGSQTFDINMEPQP